MKSYVFSNAFDGGGELSEFGQLVIADLHGAADLDAAMIGDFQIDAAAPGPCFAVFDVAGETLLAAVQIDGLRPAVGLEQGDSHMDGGGRFTRPAFLIAEHHDVRRP